MTNPCSDIILSTCFLCSMLLMCFSTLRQTTSGSLFVNDSTFAYHFFSFSLGVSSFNLLNFFQNCRKLCLLLFYFKMKTWMIVMIVLVLCMVVFKVFCFMEIIGCCFWYQLTYCFDILVFWLLNWFSLIDFWCHSSWPTLWGSCWGVQFWWLKIAQGNCAHTLFLMTRKLTTYLQLLHTA